MRESYYLESLSLFVIFLLVRSYNKIYQESAQGKLPRHNWNFSYLQTGEGGCHGDGVDSDTLGFAQMSTEVATRRSLLLLQINLGVQRGWRVGARVEGCERSLPLSLSPGESLLRMRMMRIVVPRDLTQTLAAHSGLAFKTSQ